MSQSQIASPAAVVTLEIDTEDAINLNHSRYDTNASSRQPYVVPHHPLIPCVLLNLSRASGLILNM